MAKKQTELRSWGSYELISSLVFLCSGWCDRSLDGTLYELGGRKDENFLRHPSQRNDHERTAAKRPETVLLSQPFPRKSFERNSHRISGCRGLNHPSRFPPDPTLDEGMEMDTT